MSKLQVGLNVLFCIVTSTVFSSYNQCKLYKAVEEDPVRFEIFAQCQHEYEKCIRLNSEEDHQAKEIVEKCQNQSIASSSTFEGRCPVTLQTIEDERSVDITHTLARIELRSEFTSPSRNSFFKADESRKELKDILLKNPNDLYALFNQITLFEEDDKLKKLEMYLKWVELDEDCSTTWWTFINVLGSLLDDLVFEFTTKQYDIKDERSCVKDFLQIHISGAETTDPRVGRRD